MFDCIFDDRTIEIKTIPQDVDVPPIACAASVAPLAWAEHCVECAAPACHATCAYFERNRHGRCKRTEYGFKNTPDGRGLYGQATQMKFRKWSKLRCENSERSSKPKTIRNGHSLYVLLRKTAFLLGLLLNFIGTIPKDFLASGVRHLLLKRFSYRIGGRLKSDGLLISVYSHDKNDVTLVVDAKDASDQTVCRESVRLSHGMNNRFIPAGRLRLNDKHVHALDIYSPEDAQAELTFFWCDKIVLNKNDDAVLARKDLFFSRHHAPKVKCVVWDLDNTLWSGIVGEDGAANVVLRKEAVDAVRELDQRGILCSIASKNDYQTAWEVVKRFNLDEYFLYPQISWEPKSNALATISDALNINIDSLAFIDDSPHERNEIQALCPNVRVYEETGIAAMLNDEAFDVPITADSKKRRQYYQSEMLRRSVQEQGNFSDYKLFIRECEYVVNLFVPSTDDDWERCVELFQRTNQLNSSGRRLAHEDLRTIAGDAVKKITALRCRDKYGEYGIVGCLVFDCSDGLAVTDFVCSCRVAGKKIESAVLRFLFDSYAVKHDEKIRLRYVPTERNGVLKTELLAIGGVWNESVGFIEFSRNSLFDYDLVTVVDGDTRCCTIS